MLYEDEDETGAESGRALVTSPPSETSASSGTQSSRRLRSFTRWLIAASSRTGRSNGVSDGAGVPIRWKKSGLSWRDAETQAFVEVWNQLRHQPTERECGAEADELIRIRTPSCELHFGFGVLRAAIHHELARRNPSRSEGDTGCVRHSSAHSRPRGSSDPSGIQFFRTSRRSSP